MSPAAVAATGWGWRPAGRRAWAVDGLDLRIGAGERVLLVGASGSGKSTLLRALAGVLGGDDEGERHGDLTVGGRDPRDAAGTAGLVLQDPATQMILPALFDDAAFGCENLGVPRVEISSRVTAALAAVGLDALAPATRTNRISGGQQQRLALAGAIAMRPGVLLLDEPTANLDPDGAQRVRDAVRAVADATGCTLVVVEHRTDLWLAVVDRAVVLGTGGRVVADGAPGLVLRGPEARAAGVWPPEHRPSTPRPTQAAGEPLLTTRDLVVGREGRPVASVELTVRRGVLTAVAGPNGAGKSTLAAVLGGLLAPLEGALDASPALARGLGAAPIRWRPRALAARIGSVFQSPQLQFVRATVREELAVGPRAQRATGIDARVDDLLERLGLTALAGANPFTLSGGQQRRLSVGAAVAARPDVLVLDEPTFGQDRITWDALVGLLLDERDAGGAIVAMTHDGALLETADEVRTIGATVPA